MSVFKNPFFYIPCILFWINQYVEKVQGVFVPVIHAYLDDLLAMPVILGVTLQVFRWIHPLKAGFVFTKTQVFVGVAYISLLFEGLLPYFSDRYTADIWDVVCYFLGAAVFYYLINVTEKNQSFPKK